MTRMPLMESRYCSKDDYTFATEKLKYKFVPQGHYVVRQGEQDADVYFIIKGSAKVIMKGVEEPGKYLDEKQRYNEISVLKARLTKQTFMATATAENVNQAMSSALNNMTSNMDNFMTKIK